MRKVFLMAVVFLMVAACDQKSESSSTSITESSSTSIRESVDKEIIEEAMAAVSKDLKDPSSAQFRNVRIKGGHVCGEVNAKNAMGGYVGFQRFSWYISTPDSVSFPSDTSTLCQ